MFRFAADGRVRWPVHVDQLQEDGSTTAQTFFVNYRILPRDELTAREQRMADYSRSVAALFPKDGAPDAPGAAEQRDKLTRQRIAEDDALLRERVLDWSGIADQDNKPLPFSADLLGALIGNQLLRQTLLGGLIDASLGAPAKNSPPGLAGLPMPAQA